MTETDEVRAKRFYQSHFLAHLISRHGSCDAGVIFVTLGAANQQALAVEFEWSVFYELKRAQAKTLVNHLRWPVNTIQRHNAAVERWLLRRPQRGPVNQECRNVLCFRPRGKLA